MLSKKVALNSADFAHPTDPAWAKANNQEVELVATPVAAQPSIYLKSTHQGQETGKISQVTVASLHNDSDICFRIEWQNPSQTLQRTDINVFPDGAALLFPLGEDAPLATMGDKNNPVNGWHWRADRLETAHNNIATGLGTTEITDRDNIKTAAEYSNGKWSVVFQRKLTNDADQQMKQFSAGGKVKIAYAVWDGGNKERGGLKAFSPAWLEVEIES